MKKIMDIFSDIFSEQIHENRAPRRMDFKTVIGICTVVASGAGITGYAIGQSNIQQCSDQPIHKFTNPPKCIADTITGASFIFDDKSDIYKYITKSNGEKFVREVLGDISASAQSLEDAVMVDIGANMGYYGLMSLSIGFGEVWFFDPQIQCIQMIQELVRLNQFQDKANVMNRAIGYKDEGAVSIAIDHCHGIYHTGWKRKDNPSKKEVEKVEVPFITPGTVFGNKKIFITKIDTEGSELHILGSLFPKFERKELINVLVEMTPFWWMERQQMTVKQGADIYGRVIEFGYNATSVDGNVIVTKEEMIAFVIKSQKRQIDIWFQCVDCEN